MSTHSEIEWASPSPEWTAQLGQALGAACEGGELFLLDGELGAGKTCFVRALATGLGCDPRAVRSPSYTLMHRYPGRLTLSHFDVYFTEDSIDLERNELATSLQRGEVVAVEWAGRFVAAYPADAIRIELRHDGPTARRIRVQWCGMKSEALRDRADLPPE
jgi:tRNA threonylcarbamoyladenosine biosynthesis protein TsaE